MCECGDGQQHATQSCRPGLACKNQSLHCPPVLFSLHAQPCIVLIHAESRLCIWHPCTVRCPKRSPRRMVGICMSKFGIVQSAHSPLRGGLECRGPCKELSITLRAARACFIGQGDAVVLQICQDPRAWPSWSQPSRYFFLIHLLEFDTAWISGLYHHKRPTSFDTRAAFAVQGSSM